MLVVGLSLGIEAMPEPAEGGRGPQVAEVPEERILAGRHVFERQCATCHGKWGDGRGEMAEGMRPRPRRLTSGIFKYRSTPSGFLPTDEDLRRTIRNGVGGTAMPAFGGLPERDIESVVAYVKTLSSRWRRATNQAEAVVLGPEPGWFGDAEARRPHVIAGSALYGRLCVPCHGAGGAGDGPSAGMLEDAWGEPIRPADLRQPLSRSGPGWRDLYRTLTTGLDGTPMMGFGETTTAEERWELVAFIRERKEVFQREAAAAGPVGSGE